MVAYRLKDDVKFVAQVQKATRTTKEFGIEPTHGLFGSEAWWKHIADGRLPVVTVKGVIANCYMGSMNDWPMFELLTEAGERSTWTRQLNNSVQDFVYREGSVVEVDFVWQQSRPKSWSKGDWQKNVLEIRITDSRSPLEDCGGGFSNPDYPTKHS